MGCACALVATLGLVSCRTGDDAPSAQPTIIVTSTAVTSTTIATTEAAAATLPAAATAVAAWTEDMHALADGVRRIHPEPFWREPEAEFDAALARAPEQLAALTPDLAAASVMRLVAQIDGHTGVYPSEAGFHVAALHLYRFPSGIHVVNAADPTLIGALVMTVGRTPIDAAIAAVTPYAAHDNNTTIDVVVPMLLMTPEVLKAADVIGTSAAISFSPRYSVDRIR